MNKGKTPVLAAEEARQLLDAIGIARKTRLPNGAVSEQADLAGLRDRALIGVMVYTFARVGAVVKMKVKDYFVQGRRGWVRLHEKSGKEHDVPCHHTLEKYLDEYIAAAGIAGDPDGPLFRTAPGHTGVLTRNALWQQDAYRMVQRHSLAVGIDAAHLYVTHAKTQPQAGLPVPTLATVFEVVNGGKVHTEGAALQRWIVQRRQEWKGPRGLLFSRRPTLS